MTRLAMFALRWSALCAPMEWCARWNNKVHRLEMYELFGLRRATLLDLLPWGSNLPALVEEEYAPNEGIRV